MTAPAAPPLNLEEPWQAFALADQLASQRLNEVYLQNPQLDVVMYDNAYNPIGEIGDYISTTCTWKRNAVGTGTIVLKGSDPLIAYAMMCVSTVVPITITAGPARWSGRIDTASYDMVDGVATCTLQLLDDWNWFNKLLVWPNFALPIEVQFPKEAVFVGPAVTCLEEMIAEQCIRLQLGLWEIVNNIVDPPAWFASMMEKEGLLTPIAVVPSDPLLDTSKWIAVSARMDSVATLAKQILKDNGLQLTARLWLPGEPQPTTAFTLTVPTIVVQVVDKSGVTGPTGTIVDGLIEDIADIFDGAYAEVVQPLTTSGYLPPGVNIDPAFGINWTPPWVCYYPDDPNAGVKEFHMTAHAPLAYTVVGGGKSPNWVNQLINLLLEFALSEILAAIGASGVADTLLDGVFNDVILAFQEFENAPRREALGTYGYPEMFTSTGSTAWTLDEFFALENAMWDSRGYYSYQVITYNGTPYTFGEDFVEGDLVSWVHNGTHYSDYCDSATLTDDASHRVELLCTIGDNSAEESPFSVLQRRLSGFESAIQIAMLSTN
ncbi:hypothetical protein [Speluncibacter jeojiensis]|uniref:Gp28/Gp37-like domain-containing protein n=1 Tax=Speluncibacter jeojiensis TaxID=2710754 RepID=A0A9X4LZS3_9ACTN|nr:hypothetical protein [Corynebacteriales bacterium D3-21]